MHHTHVPGPNTRASFLGPSWLLSKNDYAEHAARAAAKTFSQSHQSLSLPIGEPGSLPFWSHEKRKSSVLSHLVGPGCLHLDRGFEVDPRLA
ncbi:hypothetical protein IF2G_09696 [Cordyceps javanica]|nr:hypothetical protein IF2G_09696 [Cordyceps javanica]